MSAAAGEMVHQERRRAVRAKFLAVLLAGAALLAIGTVAGWAIYRDRIAPFRTEVLTVDDTRIRMDYFLKRVQMSGQPPLSVLQALTLEEIVKAEAPAPPYEIRVEDGDIDALLRESAQSGGVGLSDAEFAEWYRQQLNESGLTDAEFRELARVRLLIRGMRNHFAAEVPTHGPQVRLSAITFAGPEEARAAKEALDAGADFSQLARQLNRDADLEEADGDIGWHARATLPRSLGRIVFDLLETDEPSEPVQLQDRTVAILMVTDRATDRELEPEDFDAARAQAFDDWFAAVFPKHKVEYHGFDRGYDSKTDAWVREQVARREAMSGGRP